MHGNRVVIALSAIALVVSCTWAGDVLPNDALGHFPQTWFPVKGQHGSIDSTGQDDYQLLWTSLTQSVPLLPLQLRLLVESASHRSDNRFFLPLDSSKDAEPQKIEQLKLLVSGAHLTLLVRRSLNGPYNMVLKASSRDTSGISTCTLPISSTSLSQHVSCVSSRVTPGFSPLISFSASVVTYSPLSELYDIVQVSLVDLDSSLIFSSIPTVSTDVKAFLFGFQAATSLETVNTRRDEALAFESQENISTQDPPPTSPPFYNGPRVAGLVIGGIVSVVVLVALIVTMVVGGKKTSPSGKQPSNSTFPSAVNSGVGSFADGPLVQLSTATMSTGSHSPNSGSPNLMGSIPLAGGVISASMSSTLKGTYSMSPTSDTPLQGELVGNHMNQVLGGGRLNDSPNRPGLHGTAVSPPQANTGTLRSGKKTERVALVEALVYSPRARAPPKISNQALAALPTEPTPKPKPKYLASGAIPSKPLAAAARNMRYHDLVAPPPSSRPGTLRGGLPGDPFKSKRNKKKTMSTSSLGDEHMGDLDAFLGEEDGNAGLFTDDDDTWLDDVVEPHPDDATYKNDDFYVEIDVTKLALVSPPLDLDESAEYLQAHITQLSSPLAATPASMSRSSSASSVKRSKAKQTKSKSSRPKNNQSTDPSSSIPVSVDVTMPSAPLQLSKSSEVLSKESSIAPDHTLAKSSDGSSSSFLASSNDLDVPNARSLADSSSSIDSTSGAPLSPSSSQQHLSSSSSSTSASRWNFARPPRS